jgi:NAD+ kinase
MTQSPLQGQPLVPVTRMTSVGVVAKERLEASDVVRRLMAWLAERQIDVVLDIGTAALAGDHPHRVATREQLPTLVDLVVVLGGDGTLLSMAGRIAEAECDTPILGVNFGSLGFLTEIRIAELYPVLESALEGHATVDERLMLVAEAGLHRGPDTRIVLNDVVFSKPAVSRIIELEVTVGGDFVTQVKADGLIVASATGSTAYNLSAGGPIVHPVVDAIVLTPIAPHTLTNRPLVLPGSAVIEVRPKLTGNAEGYVTYDGQSGYPLRAGESVRICRAARTLRLVKTPARSYFDVLREKLKWGER